MEIHLPPAIRQRLEALARDQGRSIETVAREVLESALGVLREQGAKGGDTNQSGDRSCYDLAKAQGVIGKLKNAPRDLSTNPAHLDGFGRG